MTVETASKIAVRQMRAGDLPLLEKMYNTYGSLGETLGLPPRDPVSRHYWLHNLGRGINLVAEDDGELAGHLVLLPTGGALEMIAYVHQDFRRRGVATALTRAAIEEAHCGAFSYIWLLIAKTNFAGRRGLQKLDFRVAWQDAREMQYLFPLRAA
jgi:ribosomal protein S18 acetylase RimI-like enzyme